jgi:YD repeat-containing protein
MGSPVGQETQQSYTFYRNGTFAVDDGSGNVLTMQLAGIPAGNLSATLSANSTAALEDYVVASSGGGSVANVTAAYAVAREYCQPSGVSIVISGHADWPSGQGVIALRFGERPVSVESTRAWFGANETSGAQQLGFDWSDSSALNPHFNSTSDELTYVVGDDFTIDPSVVASNSGIDASAATSQAKLFYVNNGYLAFFSDGSNMDCSSSTNGATWSDPTTIRAATHGDYFAMALSGSTIAYAYAGGSSASFAYRYGTVPSPATCSISWSGSESTEATTNADASLPTAAFDSNGDLWVSVDTYDGTNSHLEVWELSSSWSKSKDVTLSSGASPGVGILLNLGSSKVGYVYSSSWSSASTLGIITYSGSSWSSSVSTSSTYNLAFSGATALGSTIDFCGVGTTSAKFWSFAYGGSSSPAETTLASGLTSGQDACAITTDGHSELTSIIQASSSTIDYITSTNKGSSWSPLQVLSSTENDIQSASVGTLGSSQLIAPGGIVTALWTAGSGPYSVRFASFPAVVPTAANSGKSWSAPGLSPYEQYFQDLTEFVSPGNGLLTVEQGDLSLPGRGIGLAITRVYSSPYGFRSASPYEYDNYTGANLGNGWSLNFPWLGANNLHLTDGEAYPYNWNGNSFVYHGPTNFDLVHNMGGTYTLFMPSGVQYGYASNESLLSVTDQTGNNTISFKYASGHISQITDTIGRTVAFSYNGNDQLSSISSGDRTWSYGYLDHNLVSSTDPAGRVTRYEYNDGVNRWLLTGIIYPTLGGVTSAYSSAPVGTEVKTDYVTSINTYASPMTSSLGASTSIAYDIVNGGVVWSNATISNGSTNEAHEDFNALSASNATRTYDENGTASIDQITENYYDASGRLNETKMLSADNSLLAYSTSSYDNWGNLVESRSFVGDQTWFSYANANSQNTFGTSGISNSSFYTPLTVSSNIHYALVGEASFQNGTGSAAMETYYKYSSAGDLLETKQLNGSSWLHTDYT